MTDALTNLLTNGLSAAALGQLAILAVALYLAYEARKLIKKAAAYRRVAASDAIREGDYVQTSGYKDLANWQIQSIQWDGVWLINTADHRLRRWEPHEAFLNAPRVFHRNGHPDRDTRGRFKASAGTRASG